MDLRDDTAEILAGIRAGDARAADQLFPMVYDELKSYASQLMRRERRDHTLQPTAVVNEVYLRMVDQNRVDWQGKTHFKAVAALAMRRFLTEHARFVNRKKRGGDWKKITLHEGAQWDPDDSEIDVEALERALDGLAAHRERTAKIVEMKFYGGLSQQEIAAHLDVSERTVEREWRFARAWLLTELNHCGGEAGEP